jgi:hypothetical protein
MPVKYRKLFWPTVVLIAVTSSALAFVSARTWRVGARVKEQSLIAEAAARPEGQASEEQVEVEVITVRANGFEPGEITRRSGVFMLAISNHSGETELNLHLDRVQGNRIHEERLPRGRVRWSKSFDLPSGDYVLSEQSHPDWICRIKLTAS